MKDDNLVIPTCMLIKAAAYYNFAVYDGVNLTVPLYLSSYVSMHNPQARGPYFKAPSYTVDA